MGIVPTEFVVIFTSEFSFREPLADRQQFPPALCARFRIGHFESFERIEDNPGNNQPGILLVVGGDDIPGRVARCWSH